MEMTCKDVTQRDHQPSRRRQRTKEERAITHGLHDVIGRVDRVCCLDVDGLEDEYVSEQNRILYLAETPI